MEKSRGKIGNREQESKEHSYGNTETFFVAKGGGNPGKMVLETHPNCERNLRTARWVLEECEQIGLKTRKRL